jgi:hypothetical protein
MQVDTTLLISYHELQLFETLSKDYITYYLAIWFTILLLRHQHIQSRPNNFKL